MSEHVLKLDPPAFGPDRNFLPDAVYSEDVVMILSDGSERAQAVADAFASVGAAIVAVGPDMSSAKRITGIAAGYGGKTMAASWDSPVAPVFDEVNDRVGAVDHLISIDVEEKTVSLYLQTLANAPPVAPRKRSCVFVSKPGGMATRLEQLAGEVRLNAVEVDLGVGANGPVGRAGGLFELGWAVAFLCSPYAREMDGQLLRLDGGAS